MIAEDLGIKLEKRPTIAMLGRAEEGHDHKGPTQPSSMGLGDHKEIEGGAVNQIKAQIEDHPLRITTRKKLQRAPREARWWCCL